jgi:hypothetical protein
LQGAHAIDIATPPTFVTCVFARSLIIRRPETGSGNVCVALG